MTDEILGGKRTRIFLLWLFNHVNLGIFAPYIFGLIIGNKPHKVVEEWRTK